jgi:hypothetical protein
MDWIDLTQEMNCWLAIVKTVIDIVGSKNPSAFIKCCRVLEKLH